MTYVDAIHDRKTESIRIVERIDGKRVFRDIPVDYTFYYDNPKGNFKTIFGTPVSKFSTNTNKKFRGEIHSIKDQGFGIYESDINPIFRALETHYSNVETPKLNVCFFDIEVDFDPKIGFAKPWDPYAPVNAISLYLSHLDNMITLALLPPTLTYDEGEEICKKFDNTMLFTDEKELLTTFLDLIEDSDLLSGWNSEGFDIPYMVNRIENVLGEEHLHRFCLWDQTPKKKVFMKYKKEYKTYELVGRIHLDYLNLYRKHNSQQLHSYRLDFVGEIEVKENKIPYEGTLDQLYKNDFERFIAYNRQDTLLLYKIDKKNKFIELANQIAHTNTVLLPTTMGSVQLIEQAITNEAHSKGLVVPDRKGEIQEIDDTVDDDDEDDVDSDGDSPVVGAYVAKPKKGLHKNIGSVDVNSLYPSTIRALNMGPETLSGQIRPTKTLKLIQDRIASGIKKSEAWDGLFSILEYEYMMKKDSNEIITVDFESGETIEVPGDVLYDIIFSQDSNLCISANGTIFITNKESVIAGLLARWYSERVEMKGKSSKYEKMSDGVKIPKEIELRLNGLK